MKQRFTGFRDVGAAPFRERIRSLLKYRFNGNLGGRRPFYCDGDEGRVARCRSGGVDSRTRNDDEKSENACDPHADPHHTLTL